MKAMILAAGRGERMRPLTDRVPKPLLTAGGRPLIEHLVLGLVRSGFRELVVNTAHLGEQIEAYLGAGDRYGARIEFSREGEALETGGGIYRALPLLGDGPFVVVNGDIATDFPFERLLGQPGRIAHLVLVPNPPHHAKGDFALQGDSVVASDNERLTFSGIGVYRPDLFADKGPGRFALAPLLRDQMELGLVSGEVYSGFWMDIGTEERLEVVDRHFRAANAFSDSVKKLSE